MSASSTETKAVTKSVSTSSSSSKRNEGSYSPTSLNIGPRILQRKSQARDASSYISTAIRTSLSSDIRQRVLSARQHRQKGLQNQLNVALQQNAELVNENRLLKTLHKRQDNALSKYEGSTGELPQLIKSHTDEMRVWQTKYRVLHLQNRELNKKIQQKDKMINEINDRLKYLTTLTADKHLEEREALAVKVDSLEQKLIEKEEEVKNLVRRNNLEAKNFKVHLGNERKKYRELCQKQNTERQNGSSNDSDYSSAKDANDAKETKDNESKMKHINVFSLTVSPTISEETPPSDLHVDIEDDEDLVIKHLLEPNTDKNDLKSISEHLTEIHQFAANDAQNIHNIQQKIQKDIEKNEALLDLHCDEISRAIGALNFPKELNSYEANEANQLAAFKSLNDLLELKNDDPKESISIKSDRPKAMRTMSSLPRFNINLTGKPAKRTPIDPQKKSKLLAQLKSIDAANGGTLQKSQETLDTCN